MKAAKRILELTSTIIALVISALGILGSVFLIIREIVLIIGGQIYFDLGAVSDFLLDGVSLGIFITTLILSIKMITSSRKIDGNARKKNALRITFLVFVSFYALAGIGFLFIPQTILLIFPLSAPLILIIISMSLPSELRKVEEVVEIDYSVNNVTENVIENVSEKADIITQIKELKRFKELEIIDDEQYKRAVEKLIEKM